MYTFQDHSCFVIFPSVAMLPADVVRQIRRLSYITEIWPSKTNPNMKDLLYRTHTYVFTTMPPPHPRHLADPTALQVVAEVV